MGGALLILLRRRLWNLEEAGHVGEVVHDRHITGLELLGLQEALPGMLQVILHVLRRVGALPIGRVQRI